MDRIRLLAGNSNLELARKISQYLQIDLTDSKVSRFSDGEVEVEIRENVRGRNVFILQSTSTPANEHLMELLIMIDACKRSSAQEIIAVMPYYGYARQDRKVASRAPITAKLVADLLTAAGATRVISVDLHAGQIQGFFNIPVDHLYAAPVFLEDMRVRFPNKNIVIVSPDAGGVERARAYSKRLDCSIAIVDKRRPQPNVSEVMNLIGDVEGKIAILLDDIVDTAGSLTKAATAVMEKGAIEVYAYAVHGVLSGDAFKKIEDSPIKDITITDTIALREEGKHFPKIRYLTVSRLLGEAIRRIHYGDSVSSLFV
ncbi:MAG: ribose-phosphate pyrophosphokinase [Myxococcota bacterium]